MPKICYIPKTFNPAHQAVIDQANTIITDYAAQGFDLTLRQLYYQFVSRGLIANRDQEYKRLGGIISDARRAGLIDWNAIVDRTRYLRSNPHWISPQSIVGACAEQFAYDKWKEQRYRPEVWVEKDALIGVIESVCVPMDVPYFSCRGYTSDSEVWSAARRLRKYFDGGQTPVVIHLGDHDPSGVDMSRDIQDRIRMFGGRIEFERIALNMDQIEEYNPPPNPAKLTDSRCAAYIELHGNESWELDALDPATLAQLIEDAVFAVRDVRKWETAVKREKIARTEIRKVSQSWDEVVAGLPDTDPDDGEQSEEEEEGEE